jgi:hypothetical protein
VSPATFASSIINWLRSGYPQGVPDHDYLPLFALLASRLTTEQLNDVAILLEGDASSATAAAIRAAIETVTDGDVHDVDIANVRAHLEATAGAPPAYHEPTAAERGAELSGS